ncbi:MAG: hypothetical protein EOO29_28345 [Comamonadaceae bacterium]|nr:MAG: hypothetical protein EOO29_28345 [Comamonadaceae bacterium]
MTNRGKIFAIYGTVAVLSVLIIGTAMYLGSRVPEQPPEQKQPAREAPAVQATAPTHREHALAPATPATFSPHPAPPVQSTPSHAIAPLPVANVEPLQPVAATPVMQSTDPATAPAKPAPMQPQLAAQPAASDMTAVHMQMAAMQEEIRRLSARRGQEPPLQRSGMDDKQTVQTAMRTEPVAPSRPTDPRDFGHPHHQDFQKIYTAVVQHGRWDAQQSTNIAARVLADFKAGPMGQRADMVAIEPDSKGHLQVYAGYQPSAGVRGYLGIAVVEPAQAARVPMEQSFDRLAQTDPQQALQAQQRTQQARDQGVLQA